MGGSFEDRRRAAEAKWAHDEELRFKVMARRNRLLGEWAAGEMGYRGPQMQEYAKSVVQTDLGEPGHHDVFSKIRADLNAGKVVRSDDVIRRKMDELLVIAGEQVLGEADRK